MGEVRGSIKTDRKISYRRIVVCEESFSSLHGGQAETNWGVRYVIYEFPHRRRFFASPGAAVEFIDFYLDVTDKLANPPAIVNMGKPEGDSGGS